MPEQYFIQRILADGQNNSSIILSWNYWITMLLIFGGILNGCSSQLKWNHKKNYRWAKVSLGYWEQTGFKRLSSSQTNIHFKNKITEKEITQNRIYLNGSGVTAGDIDGDGLVDLYFARLNGPNRLYKNLGGMKFEDITDKAGVMHKNHYSTGAVFADVNGNDRLDLLVTSMHNRNALYINQGNDKFILKQNSGLGPAKGSMTMTLADIDNDRDLDLYITHYKEKSVKDIYTSKELTRKNILNEKYVNRTKKYSLISPFDKHYQSFITKHNKLAGIAQTGETDELYLNNEGIFKKVLETEKIFLSEDGEPFGLQPDWGLTAKFKDLNNDDLPDLYVCNDFFSPDRIWINQGNGTFKAIKWSAIRNTSFASMGVDFSDINQDGLLDIFTTEMLSPVHSRHLRQVGLKDPTPNRNEQLKYRPQYNRNSMYLKRRDDTYAEISYLSKTEATGWSWATKFMDVNLDGYEDLIVNTGYAYDILDIDTQLQLISQNMNLTDDYGTFIRKTPPLNLINKLLINNGDLTFTDKSATFGFREPDVSLGMATADLDNDGDLDLVTNRMNEVAAVYENKARAPRILVTLKGKKPNTRGIGAQVILQGGSHAQKREITAGGDYLSGSSPEAMFAANDNALYKLIVNWPDGKQSSIDSVKANRIYEIDESGAQLINNTITYKKEPSGKSLFKDISNRITYKHHEDAFNDFDVQSQLPNKLSRLGPGISWIDFNQDGKDDLFIPSGKGGMMGIFKNLGNSQFKSVTLGALNQTALGDQTAIIGWIESGKTHFILGSSNYEQGEISAPSAHEYISNGTHLSKNDSIPGIFSTTGSLAVADYDYDGDLDLFVGGRFLPGQYPRNATSRLLKKENGHFQLDQSNTKLLNKIGLVTGAEFTDYNNDGYQDLLLSTEWGSLHLFKNKNGTFHEVTKQVKLDTYKGWWNSVATGDFNNDGLPDIIATNIGLNSSYQLKYDKPIRMYYDDLNYNRHTNIIETYANKDGNYVPKKRLYAYNSIPIISNRMNSYKQFANTTLKDIFKDQLSNIPYKEINMLNHMLFINTGKGFEAHSLPQKSQFSAAFDASIADFNNDGNEDLFLSQNFFDFPREKSRLDAGRGLILKGNGQGDFSPVSGNISGIKIYGEQRGAALADFNADAKVDLAVSQNDAFVKLYVNQTKRFGIRIRLKGPPNNALAIGSSIRLVYSDRSKGPVREIKAGSGYWSQNSAVQIMGIAKPLRRIEISWFDGVHQTVEATKDKKNYVVTYPGPN